jgi:FkbM family methyltransferase
MKLPGFLRKLGWLFGHKEFHRRPIAVIARVAQWEFYRFRGKPADLVLGEFKVRARPGDGIGRLICYFGEAADEMFGFLESYLKPGMTMVDVGANIGTHSLYAGRAVAPGGHVYAFEPEPGTRSVLERNLSANGLKNVIVSGECVTDKPGRVVLNINADSAKTSMVRAGKSQIEVHADSLDNLLPRDIDIDLLKIDVEGADYKVLVGSKHFFETSPPKIVVIEATDGKDAIASFLRSKGYELYQFDRDSKTLSQLSPGTLNWYAVHPSVSVEKIGSGIFPA